PGFGSFGANSRSLALRPGDSLTIRPMALSIGFRVLVSLHPAIQATGRLALAPTGLAPARRTCLLWTRDHLIRPQQQRRGMVRPRALAQRRAYDILSPGVGIDAPTFQAL